ncbi:hypothetical protein [Alloactinosynnema sp. L-07]|nr:hypothetical protein [Alloactinosynnema sp. L-07]
MRRLLIHWLNLPAIHSPVLLRTDVGDRWSAWTGRWRLDIGPWRLTLDRRNDHGSVWDAIGSNPGIAMTHVMEIVRVDGRHFTACQVEP